MARVVKKVATDILFLSLIAIWSHSPLAAQTGTPIVSVPSLEFFDPAYYVYTVGEPFKINVDYSPLEAKGNLESLRARVFRGTYENLRTNIGKRLVGNCVTYFSTVFNPLEYNGGIDFGLNFDEHWLHPEGSSNLTEENYLLVFELHGPAGRWLDLDRNSVDRYFRQGFPFIVQPDRSIKAEEAGTVVSEMRGQAKQVNQDLVRRQAATAQTSSSPSKGANPEAGTVEIQASLCWRFRLVRTESAMVPLLEPVVCGSKELSPSHRSWLSRIFGA